MHLCSLSHSSRLVADKADKLTPYRRTSWPTMSCGLDAMSRGLCVVLLEKVTRDIQEQVIYMYSNGNKVVVLDLQ